MKTAILALSLSILVISCGAKKKTTFDPSIANWLGISAQTPSEEKIHRLTTALGIETHYSTHIIYAKGELIKIGTPAVPALISVLTGEFMPSDAVLELTKDRRVKFDVTTMLYGAEIVLSRIGQPAVSPLIGLLENSDAETHTRVVNALKKIGNSQAMEAVRKFEAAH